MSKAVPTPFAAAWAAARGAYFRVRGGAAGAEACLDPNGGCGAGERPRNVSCCLLSQAPRPGAQLIAEPLGGSPVCVLSSGPGTIRSRSRCAAPGSALCAGNTAVLNPPNTPRAPRPDRRVAGRHLDYQLPWRWWKRRRHRPQLLRKIATLTTSSSPARGPGSVSPVMAARLGPAPRSQRDILKPSRSRLTPVGPIMADVQGHGSV